MWQVLLAILPLITHQEIISGRAGQPLYQVEVPQGWTRAPLQVNDDTTLPLAEFNSGGAKVVIHNFPGRAITPYAQVERWKRQTPPRRIEPQAFSGFRGLFFEADTTLAWALEWGASRKIQGEAASDVTIKATGAVQAKREEIVSMARSFELIEAPCEW